MTRDLLPYTGNAETIHFVNFVLHSGHADPAKLVRQAREEAKGTDDTDLTEEKLTGLLEDALAEWASEFVPDYNHYCDGADGFPERLESYQGRDAHCLVAPLLGRALAQIDVGTAARLILEHSI